MFTGLVETVGQIAGREPENGGVRLGILSALGSELAVGESLAVNGVCLTVARIDGDRIETNVGPETLRVTTLGELGPGVPVNLERPLRADGRFGGHFVQGHADAIGRIEELRRDVEYGWLTVSFPADLAPYVVRKGSIAVDGISLTVATLAVDRFEVQLVPHTMEHTNLKAARVGDHVNLECDVIGKYVVRACQSAGLEVNVRA